MYKLLTILFIIIIATFAIDHAVATDSTIKATVGGYGGAISEHSDSTKRISGSSLGFITGGANYYEENIGNQMVALGDASYSESMTSNDRIKPTTDVSRELIYTSQAATDTNYALTVNKAAIPDAECNGGQSTPAIMDSEGNVIEGQKPSYQSVNVALGGLGADGGRYKDSGVINDANLTVSSRAEGNTGMFIANTFITAEAGFNSSSNDMNYDHSINSHSVRASFNKTGYYLPYDLEYTDHSEPLETIKNVTRLETVEPTNETVIGLKTEPLDNVTFSNETSVVDINSTEQTDQ